MYGYIQTLVTQNTPQTKDQDITTALKSTFQDVNTNTSIDFPYVSKTPVHEYDITMILFYKAFL